MQPASRYWTHAVSRGRVRAPSADADRGFHDQGLQLGQDGLDVLRVGCRRTVPAPAFHDLAELFLAPDGVLAGLEESVAQLWCGCLRGGKGEPAGATL